jgi:hypothetical protein
MGLSLRTGKDSLRINHTLWMYQVLSLLGQLNMSELLMEKRKEIGLSLLVLILPSPRLV